MRPSRTCTSMDLLLTVNVPSRAIVFHGVPSPAKRVAGHWLLGACSEKFAPPQLACARTSQGVGVQQGKFSSTFAPSQLGRRDHINCPGKATESLLPLPPARTSLADPFQIVPLGSKRLTRPLDAVRRPSASQAAGAKHISPTIAPAAKPSHALNAREGDRCSGSRPAASSRERNDWVFGIRWLMAIMACRRC